MKLIFDIHGVLQPQRDIPVKEFDELCTELISSKLGTPKFVGNAVYRVGKKLHKDSTSLLMLRLGVYEKYLESFDRLPIDAKPDPELADMLTKLKKTHRLYVATNNPAYFASRILSELGIPETLFEKVVTADDCRPRPYTDQFGLLVDGDKKDWVFFGDRPTIDIYPARKFGINAVLVDNNVKEILKNYL